MRGPSPRPVERTRMLDNPGHKKLPAAPTTTGLPAAVRAPRPARPLDRSAMAIWRRLWTWAGPWLSPGTDLEIITRYVENIQLRANIVERIPADMMTIGSHGTLMIHPLMRQLNQTERLLLQLETHLGFAPADRSRIGAAEVRAATSLDSLNERRERRRAEREKMRADGSRESASS